MSVFRQVPENGRYLPRYGWKQIRLESLANRIGIAEILPGKGFTNRRRTRIIQRAFGIAVNEPVSENLEDIRISIVDLIPEELLALDSNQGFLVGN
jgi:hypothetical protein